MSLSSLLEKIASTREGSSYGANARLIKRLQAGVSKLRKGNESETANIQIQEDGARNVPLSTGTTAVLPEEAGVAELALSMMLRFSSRDELWGLGTPSISWTSSLI